MSAPLVDVAISSKRFAGKRVLADIAFQVHPGEIVSLVGPSGCGKSTLLRVIGGLDTDYEGRVEVLGHTPRLDSREIGFVFQEPRLLPWLTVAQNIGFGAGPAGGRDPKVADLLAEVGLADFADAYPKQLSGGMAQRAAIARALFTSPALLLLDEPFSALDPFTRARLQDLLLSVAARRGATLVLVTHDIDEAVYLGDRVLSLPRRAGRFNGQIDIDHPRPRERRHPELVALQAQALALLETVDESLLTQA